MKISNTSERLKTLMASRKLRQVDILEKCEPFCKRFGVQLKKNALSEYVNGKTEPGQHKLTILGLALNVSEAWLMGFDVPMERDTGLSVNEEQVNRTNEFVKLFNLLNSEQQKLIIAQIRGILASQSSDDASEPTQKIWLAASSSDDQAPAIVEVSKAKVKAAQDDHSLKNEEDL